MSDNSFNDVDCETSLVFLFIHNPSILLPFYGCVIIEEYLNGENWWEIGPQMVELNIFHLY